MMAKPMKTLELHYPMIQFSIMIMNLYILRLQGVELIVSARCWWPDRHANEDSEEPVGSHDQIQGTVELLKPYKSLKNGSSLGLPVTLTEEPIDRVRIFSFGLELACNGGSCGGISLKREKFHLHLKRLPALASLAS